MADDVSSNLSLDASKLIAEFQKMTASINEHFKALQALVGASKQYNSAQASMESSTNEASEALKKQKQFALDTANALRQTFAGRTDSSATLAEIKKVNDAFTALQKTLVSTKATPAQVSQIANNLKGSFTGVDSVIQSALIAAKNAQAQLGSSNAGQSFKINEANVASQVKQQAAAAAQVAQQQAAAVANAFSGKFSTAAFNPAQLNAFNAAAAKLQTAAQRSGLSVQQLSTIVNSSGTAFTGQAAKVNKAAQAVTALAAAAKSVPPNLGGGAGGGGGFNFNIPNLANVFAFQQALRGFGLLQTALVQSIPNAIEFERQLAQIATISTSADKNIDNLGSRIEFLSGELGKPAPELAAGFYQALSNQVGDTSETIQFFTEAIKFSKAAVADTSDAINALSGIQNAYGQTSASTAHNADVLFRTIDLGRVGAKELGDSFGRILPIASQLGVSLEEVSAAIATATVQGVKFQDAQTQILNLLTSSLKPTEAFTARMKELGIAGVNAGIASKGFIGFFSSIAEGAKSSEELAKLFPNIRGLRGEISLFADGGKKMQEALDNIATSATAAGEAFNTIQTTNAEKLTKELDKLQAVLLNDIGRPALAVLASLNEAFGGLTNTVLVLGGALTVTFGTVVTAVAINQIIAAVTGLAGAFGVATAAVGTFGLVAGVALAGVAAGFLILKSKDLSGQFIEQFHAVEKAAGETATRLAEVAREINAPFKAAIEAQAKDLLSLENKRQIAFDKILNKAVETEGGVTDVLKSSISKRISLIEQFTAKTIQLQNDAAQNERKIRLETLDAENKVDQKRFERRLGDQTPQGQANSLIERAQKFQSSSQKSLQAGDFENAKKFAEQALDFASRAAEITGQRRQGEAAETAALNNFKSIQAQVLAADQERTKQAQKLQEANEPTATKLKEVLNQEKDLLTQRQKLLDSKVIDPKQFDELDAKIKELDAKAAELTKKLQALPNSQGPKEAGQQDANDLLKQIQKPALDVPGALADFRKRIADATAADPVLIGAKIGLDGTAGKQNQIADLLKRSQQGLDKEIALPGLALNVDTAKQKLDGLFATLKQIFKNQQTSNGVFFDKKQQDANVANVEKFQQRAQTLLDSLKFDEGGTLTAKSKAEFDNFIAEIQAAKRTLEDSPTGLGFATDAAKNLGQLDEALKRVIESQQTLNRTKKESEAGVEAQKQLEEFSKQKQIQDEKAAAATQAATQAQQTAAIETASANTTVTAGQTVVQSLETQVTATQTLNQTIGLTGTTGTTAGGQVVSSLGTIGSTATAQISGVQALTTALIKLAEARASGGGGGGEAFAARGGPMHFFANGGIAPRGSDRIHTMLGAGETVINAGSSRKFFSELMAINAGVQPSFRSNGGPVGDQFGDINVSINSTGSGDVDGRKIAQQIRREIRKGRIRL